MNEAKKSWMSKMRTIGLALCLLTPWTTTVANAQDDINNVIAALNSKVVKIRREAVESFGETASSLSVKDVAPVTRKALKDPVAEVRFYGIILVEAAIWGAVSQNAVRIDLEILEPVLVAALQDSDARVRATAAGIFAYVGTLPTGAEERLKELAVGDERLAAEPAARTLVEKGRDRAAVQRIVDKLVTGGPQWRRTLGARLLTQGLEDPAAMEE